MRQLSGNRAFKQEQRSEKTNLVKPTELNYYSLNISYEDNLFSTLL